MRTPEMRTRTSERMKAQWARRQSDPEAMAVMREALSRGHEGKWTPERRAAVDVSHLHTPEVWAKAGLSRRGKRHGKPAVGKFIGEADYSGQTMRYDHPLASAKGILLDHRAALYEKIGDGPHECHWNFRYGCGQVQLQWGGRDGIHVDHLDDDKVNNNPDNLVPSCRVCNMRRGREAKLVERLRLAGAIAPGWQIDAQKG